MLISNNYNLFRISTYLLSNTEQNMHKSTKYAFVYKNVKHMHLFEKLRKYTFTHAGMQMHNYLNLVMIIGNSKITT